ncbi:MAG: hypothetical protein NC453_12280 [Muribaculum sp.]|nr:hypothetical protein [Muribaculum sp.]
MITLYKLMQSLANIEPFGEAAMSAVEDLDCHPRVPAVWEVEAVPGIMETLKLLSYHATLREPKAIMLVLFSEDVTDETVETTRWLINCFASDLNIKLEGLAFGRNADVDGVKIIYTEYHSPSSNPTFDAQPERPILKYGSPQWKEAREAECRAHGFDTLIDFKTILKR